MVYKGDDLHWRVQTLITYVPPTCQSVVEPCRIRNATPFTYLHWWRKEFSNSILPRDLMLERYMSKLGICRSVCASVCHKPVLYQRAKRRIKQTTPHITSEARVFCCQTSAWNLNGVTPTRGAKYRLGRLKISLYIRNGARYIVTIDRRQWELAYIRSIERCYFHSPWGQGRFFHRKLIVH